MKIPRFCCGYFQLMCACVCATLRVKIPRFRCSYSRLMCSEFSLENEVLKLFFLAGIFGCPTVRKFHEFVAAVAGLLFFFFFFFFFLLLNLFNVEQIQVYIDGVDTRCTTLSKRSNKRVY